MSVIGRETYKQWELCGHCKKSYSQIDLEGKLQAYATIMLHQKQIMRTHEFKKCSVGEVRNFRLNTLSPDNDWPFLLKNLTLFGLKRLINCHILSATPNVTTSFAEESGCSAFPLRLGSYGRSSLLHGAWSTHLTVQLTGTGIRVAQGRFTHITARSCTGVQCIGSTHKRVLCSSQMWQYWLWIQAPHKICQLRSCTHPWAQGAETEPAQMSLLRQHRSLKKVLENCPPCLAA